MKIDKFTDGNGKEFFALRVGGSEDKPKYLDLKNKAHSWSINSPYFEDCLVDDIEIIKGRVFTLVKTIEVEEKLSPGPGLPFESPTASK